MTREDFCNKIEVKCFECKEICDKYSNAECVEDLCKKNLVAEFESEIRADERRKFAEWIDKSYIPRNVGYKYLIKQYISETMKGGVNNES